MEEKGEEREEEKEEEEKGEERKEEEEKEKEKEKEKEEKEEREKEEEEEEQMYKDKPTFREFVEWFVDQPEHRCDLPSARASSFFSEPLHSSASKNPKKNNL